MKRGSTIFLKSVVILLGLIVLALAILWLPTAIKAELGGDFDYLPILLGMYVTAIPFFIALYQALNLLGYIDNNKAFSLASVKALEIIKYCAAVISVFYAIWMPYIFYLADRDDAPGIAAIGFVIVGASAVISTAAALFQRLFQNAVDIKSENDLTV